MRSSLCLIIAGFAAIAIAIAGCGGSSNGLTPARHLTPRQTLARAAFVSSGEPGYKTRVTLSADFGSAGHLSASGIGSFSPAGRSGVATVTLTLPGSASSLGQLQTQMIAKGDNLYIKLPASLAAIIPGGKQWLALNASSAGSASSLPGFGSLLQYQGSLTDPGQYLSYLEAASANGVQKLGTETINGVQTTHYRAEVDLSKLAAEVPAADRSATAKIVAGLQKRGHVSQIPIDVWIDSNHHVRRIEINYSASIPVATGGTPQNVAFSLTVDFLGYGEQRLPAAPPASETENAKAIAHIL